MKASFGYFVSKDKLESWTIHHFSVMVTKMIPNKRFLGSKEIPALEFQLESGTYASCTTTDKDGNPVTYNYSDAKFRDEDIVFENSRIRYLMIEK